MSGSLNLSWIIVLVLMLRPVIDGMEMVHAAEEHKFENRKVKESAPARHEKEQKEMKKGGTEEAEKRQLNKYHEECTSDPPCIAACKKDGFCTGQCMQYICYCIPNCTSHHNHYPPQLN